MSLKIIFVQGVAAINYKHFSSNNNPESLLGYFIPCKNRTRIDTNEDFEYDNFVDQDEHSIELDAISEENNYRKHKVENNRKESVILSSMNRRKAVEKTHWKYKPKPKKNGRNLPNLIFHGIRQECKEGLIRNLEDKIYEGTNAFT